MGQQQVKATNSKPEVKLRESMMLLQSLIGEGLESGDLTDTSSSLCEYEHIFTPKYEQFGCHNYVRILHMDAGQVVIGEIHKIPMINVLLKGRVRCATEDGFKIFQAPAIFVSPAGNKRGGVIEEDAIWVNIMPTSYGSEDELDAVKEEALAKDFSEVGLVCSSSELERLEGKNK